VRSPSNAVAPRDPVTVGRRTRERTERAARPSDNDAEYRGGERLLSPVRGHADVPIGGITIDL
jgi:hypothetical protein